MNVVFLVFLFMIGAAMGSFVCCQAQRIRLKQKKKKKMGKRSVCLSCGYQLRWYDNVPVISWIVLGGKCRKCQKKIGLVEFLSELFMGISFLLIGLSFGDVFALGFIDWIYLVLMMVFVTILGFLAIYDGKWGELPQIGLTFSVVCGIILLILKQWTLFLSNSSCQFLGGNIVSALGGIGILAGLYFLLCFFSKGRLVGDGDWLLGLAIALSLGNWWLSLIVLFLSNFMAAVVMIPFARGKNKKIYFGPWMIFAFVLVFVFQDFLLSFLIF